MGETVEGDGSAPASSSAVWRWASPARRDGWYCYVALEVRRVLFRGDGRRGVALCTIGLEGRRLALVGDVGSPVSPSPWSCVVRTGVKVNRAVLAGHEGNPGVTFGDSLHLNS